MVQLALVLSLLASGDEWAQLPPAAPVKPPPAVVAAPPPAPAPIPGPDLSPRARYDTAVRYLAGNRPADASAVLDLLIAEFPRVPEYFAARAQAQLAVSAPLFAAADAQYALALKPDLIGTRFVLASAEEALGHPTNAAYHYRLYADSPLPDARADLKAEAQRRAARLSPSAPAPQYAAPPQYAAQPRAPAPSAQAPSCRMGSDGRQACGYNCRVGSDGVAACADTPDGACALSSNGSVSCSRVGGGGRAFSEPTECRLGSDGRQACGYNCRVGSNGRAYCASRPDGHCALNSDGTFSCP